ncbi:HMG (high mobility group) box protein [Rhizoctonia solani AG-3 Rhs1AP]|uniref:HMG (High mobility group) box protein n=1 Tax=Rhizoctonia solani AG-3 Rhs1AP TaxID=1086054 RepID=X8JLY9_9AGAM|nr:HMG (high mobility group) box protein [Rhizoctonia solani AG-3 Rhs1AP]
MASSDRQPEGPSVEEFEGKQAELVDKLTEISTSMRQCADIFDSFTRFVRQFSFGPTVPEASVSSTSLAPSRGSGSAERSDPPSNVARAGSPFHAQGTEGHRRSAYPYPPGPMLPPAAPTFHAAGLSGVHSSLASMHSIAGPPSYPSHRPSSSTSGTGSGGAHETGAPSHRMADTASSVSEHRSSSIKHGKRKRAQPAEGEYGDESDIDAGAERSSQTEAHEVPSEIEQAPRRPLKRSAESMDESLSARVFLPRSKAGTETPHTEDRLAGTATGPSIVVFSSGAGSSKTRTIHSRGPAQTSTRARKEKKPKDPNAPKQPPPAYIVYQNEIRESMRSRFPTHSPTELVKEIAATWKTLPNSERQRYKDYATGEKDRWQAELAAYQASLTNPDEGQKGSESTFLATTGVSDSPPGSSRQSPELSDIELDPHKVRRVVSQLDVPGTSGSYERRGSVRVSSSFPGPSVAGMPPSGGNRPGRRAGPEYGGQSQEQPIRLEHSRSRHDYTPSPSPGLYGSMSIPPPPGGRAYPGHMEPRTSSTRLPSIGSLGFSHTLQSGPRESSPGPTRELSETEGEPAPKRQRTKTEEEESDGLSRLTHEGRESE